MKNSDLFDLGVLITRCYRAELELHDFLESFPDRMRIPDRCEECSGPRDTPHDELCAPCRHNQNNERNPRGY